MVDAAGRHCLAASAKLSPTMSATHNPGRLLVVRPDSVSPALERQIGVDVVGERRPFGVLSGALVDERGRGQRDGHRPLRYTLIENN